MKRVGRDIAHRRTPHRRPDQQRGRHVRIPPAHRRRLRAHVRAEPSGLFRPDRRVAGAPARVGAGSRDQHELRRASGRDARIRRSAIRARLSFGALGMGFGSAARAIASTGDRSCATSSSRASWRDSWMALASPPTVSIRASSPPASAIRVAGCSPLAFGRKAVRAVAAAGRRDADLPRVIARCAKVSRGNTSSDAIRRHPRLRRRTTRWRDGSGRKRLESRAPDCRLELGQLPFSRCSHPASSASSPIGLPAHESITETSSAFIAAFMLIVSSARPFDPRLARPPRRAGRGTCPGAT